ncbi:MAG: MFS transporter [Pseudomonadota bacterium]|nr:MFS transporter [Pseudomonadota bacterium]
MPFAGCGEALLNLDRWRTPTMMLACAGLVLMLALGIRQSFGLFLRPMSMDLGWGREAFSFAIALQNLVWGLAMPFAGAIADRKGAGRVIVAGGVLYTLGLYAMAHATTPLLFNLSAGLLVGLGLSGTGFGVVLAVVARAFPPERRSFAVGIAGACGSFGQFAMLPAGQGLIGAFGWLAALATLAALAFLMIPLGGALAGRNSAANESTQSIGAALAEAGNHGGFWLLTGSFLVCGFQTLFIMVHLPAYLVDRGLGAQHAMAALATIGLFNIAGSLAAGALGARYSRKWLLFWVYAVRAVAIGLFVTAPISLASTYLFAAVMGFTWLGTVPLTNSLVGQIFGLKYLSTLFSIAFLGHQLGAFAGAWAGGAIFDATGSYLWVWIGSIALSVLACAMCLPIDERAIVRSAAGSAA